MNSDENEIRKFDEVARAWWDPRGAMRSLHKINPLRMNFIQERLDVRGCRILDVGCGGGILSETLAEAGAQVTGIDLSRDSVEAAREHAKRGGLKIDYEAADVDQIRREWAERFDAVMCMEMLEHVPEPRKIVEGCTQVLKPGGHFFCSTVNRTLKAFIFAIIGGEYILHLLPRGSHRYARLIRPEELRQWVGEAGLDFESYASLVYHPFKRTFSLALEQVDINYLMHFTRLSSSLKVGS
jgi:2-polyprenyl-6-hydroxyphenyl methylase/3-demethylubiquinone-9 3-methyltransferase